MIRRFLHASKLSLLGASRIWSRLMHQERFLKHWKTVNKVSENTGMFLEWCNISETMCSFFIYSKPLYRTFIISIFSYYCYITKSFLIIDILIFVLNTSKRKGLNKKLKRVLRSSRTPIHVFVV